MVVADPRRLLILLFFTDGLPALLRTNEVAARLFARGHESGTGWGFQRDAMVEHACMPWGANASQADDFVLFLVEVRVGL